MQKIIVSMTSYPARISYVEKVLESIVNQTVMPDKIILYLSASQFLGCEHFPDFSRFEKRGFEIRWNEEDLGPHKKYFYVMQEFPEAIVITVDDDILYKSTMIEELLHYHRKYPAAVIARRAHLMTCTAEGEIASYSEWCSEYDLYKGTPRMDMVATGCGGVLYPPHIFGAEVFNKTIFMENSRYADDMWLKVMEVYHAVPTVLASDYFDDDKIKEISNTGLHRTINANDGNDRQLKKLLGVYNAMLEEGDSLEKRIFSDGGMTSLEANNVLLEDLFEEVRVQDAILIYGAGAVAKQLYFYLKTQGYASKVKAFIVEDVNENVDVIDSVPVKAYAEYIDKSDMIVIGLWYTKQEEIYQTLSTQGVATDRIRKLTASQTLALQNMGEVKWEGSSNYWEQRYKLGG